MCDRRDGSRTGSVLSARIGLSLNLLIGNAKPTHPISYKVQEERGYKIFPISPVPHPICSRDDNIKTIP